MVLPRPVAKAEILNRSHMHSLIKKIKYSALSYTFYDLFLKLRADRAKAFIFVATTGRTGSTSLRTIFGGLPRCASFHEPYPLMANRCPPGVDRNRYYRDQFFRRKLPMIRMASLGRDYYVETSHQFVKHFAEYAIEALGSRIRILHLVREPIKVASSFFSLNSIPGISSRGQKYLLDPAAEDNIIRIDDLLSQQPFSHDFFRCVWYWYEVEARIKRLKKNHPHLKWHYMQTGDLNRPEALDAMFRSFELPLTIGNGVSSPVTENLKTERKIRHLASPEAQAMHQLLLERMEARYGPSFWR